MSEKKALDPIIPTLCGSKSGGQIPLAWPVRAPDKSERALLP